MNEPDDIPEAPPWGRLQPPDITAMHQVQGTHAHPPHQPYPWQYGPPPGYPYPAPSAAAAASASSTVVVGGGRYQRFPHLFHLIATVLTCGLWAPIWVIHWAVDRMDRR